MENLLKTRCGERIHNLISVTNPNPHNWGLWSRVAGFHSADQWDADPLGILEPLSAGSAVSPSIRRGLVR